MQARDCDQTNRSGRGRAGSGRTMLRAEEGAAVDLSTADAEWDVGCGQAMGP